MWDAIKDALLRAASYLAAWFAGRVQEQKAQAEKDAAAAKQNAQDWADQPGTGDDFHAGMRERIQRKRKAKD